MLARHRFEGRALSSPVVSDGRVYLGFGNSAIPEAGEDPRGGVLALGLPDSLGRRDAATPAQR